jgi:hypothetical protein
MNISNKNINQNPILDEKITNVLIDILQKLPEDRTSDEITALVK